MALNCTMAEVAAFFGCNKKTIERRMKDDEEFAEIIDHGRADGMLSVRRQQFQIMESGNATMAIWLGKQLLGQRDQIDTVQEHKPISIEIVNPYALDD
jgi:hypothetical protein